MSAGLRFEGLSFRYDEEAGAELTLDGVGGTVEPSELVVIIGPNGAGKSTLLRLLAGLEEPLAGTIALAGSPLGELDHRARARALSLVPQALNALPEVRVGDFVLSGRYAHQRGWRSGSPDDRRVVAEALVACDVERFADRLLAQLSSGQRQRVLIARALAQAAPTMMVDEPTSNLDPAHKLAVFDLLAKLAAEGRAVLVVTHDLNLASQYADRVLVMNAGRIAAEGPPADVLRPEVLTPIYGNALVFGERETPDGVRPFVMAWRR